MFIFFKSAFMEAVSVEGDVDRENRRRVCTRDH